MCVHVILGLPGETAAEMMRTAEQIAPLGIDGIKLFKYRPKIMAALLDEAKKNRLGSVAHLAQTGVAQQVPQHLLGIAVVRGGVDHPSAEPMEGLEGLPERGHVVAADRAPEAHGADTHRGQARAAGRHGHLDQLRRLRQQGRHPAQRGQTGAGGAHENEVSACQFHLLSP